MLKWQGENGNLQVRMIEAQALLKAPLVIFSDVECHVNCNIP